MALIRHFPLYMSFITGYILKSIRSAEPMHGSVAIAKKRAIRTKAQPAFHNSIDYRTQPE